MLYCWLALFFLTQPGLLLWGSWFKLVLSWWIPPWCGERAERKYIYWFTFFFLTSWEKIDSLTRHVLHHHGNLIVSEKSCHHVNCLYDSDSPYPSSPGYFSLSVSVFLGLLRRGSQYQCLQACWAFSTDNVTILQTMFEVIHTVYVGSVKQENIRASIKLERSKGTAESFAIF